MSKENSKLITSVSLGLALMGAISFLPPVNVACAQAMQATSAFAGLSGKWSGDGSIVLPNGSTERLRCDAAYEVGGGGDNLDQTLQCVSDSYNFDLRVNLEDNGGAIVGSWNEVTKSVAGGISGQGAKGLIRVVVSGQNLAANVVVKTQGNKQAVSIRSQSGDLAQVTITLHRVR